MPNKSLPDKPLPDKSLPDKSLPDKSLPDRSLPDTSMEPRRTVEQRAVEVVRLLGAVVAKMRTPLLWVSLLPALPALVLALIGAGHGSWFPAAVGIIAMVPSVWLTVRRRQLVEALQPPEVAVAELRATFNAAELGTQLLDNLRTVRAKKLELRPRKMAGALWKGLKLGVGLHSRFTDIPRLQPFLPGRLRGLAFLGAACIIVAGVLALVDLVVLLSLPL